jgi:hypothetical protein
MPKFFVRVNRLIGMAGFVTVGFATPLVQAHYPPGFVQPITRWRFATILTILRQAIGSGLGLGFQAADVANQTVDPSDAHTFPLTISLIVFPPHSQSNCHFGNQPDSSRLPK